MWVVEAEELTVVLCGDPSDEVISPEFQFGKLLLPTRTSMMSMRFVFSSSCFIQDSFL